MHLITQLGFSCCYLVWIFMANKLAREKADDKGGDTPNAKIVQKLEKTATQMFSIVAGISFLWFLTFMLKG